MREDIRFYGGIAETSYNHHPVAPGPYACIAPVYGAREDQKRMTHVRAPSHVPILQDSGAFSDGPGQRLSYGAALERQQRHAERFGYASQIEAIASYDCLLVDEIWENGIRRKERWGEEAGEFAVKASVMAAKYLIRHRAGIPLILSAQGVSPAQYLRCAQQIVPLMEGADRFGLGGWCIIGKNPKHMMPVFREAMQSVIPFLGREGVKQVHIWGSCYAPALGELLYLCDRAGISISTDNAGASLVPVRGQWGYASWRVKQGAYTRPPVLDSCREGICPPGTYCRGLERARHVQETYAWLAHFREREPALYRFVPLQERAGIAQLGLFGEAV